MALVAPGEFECEYCGAHFPVAEGDRVAIHPACPGPHPFAGGDAVHPLEPAEAEGQPEPEQSSAGSSPEHQDQERQQ